MSASPAPADERGAARDPARLPLALSLFGWYGTAAILAAYFLSSHGLLERGVPYQLLNLTGALGVGLVCWWRRAWQPLWLEVVWGAVAVSALLHGSV